jgi:hypothetical protein
MRRMSRFVGHYAPRLLIAVVAILILQTLMPMAPPFIAWLGLMVLLVLVLVLAASIFSHNRGLCERCIASVPLDASAVAVRYSTRFRVAHLFERKLFGVCYLAAVLGCSFVYAHPVGKYLCAAAQASLAYLLLVYVSHQRLQPWCPLCRGGGEEQLTPTAPTPVSSSL